MAECSRLPRLLIRGVCEGKGGGEATGVCDDDQIVFEGDGIDGGGGGGEKAGVWLIVFPWRLALGGFAVLSLYSTILSIFCSIFFLFCLESASPKIL